MPPFKLPWRPCDAPRPRPRPPRASFHCDVLERRVLLSADSNALAAAAAPPDSPGVFARFYNNTTRSGEPAFSEVAPAIDFDFGTAAPRPGVSADGFSARFSGTLRAPLAGYYTFVTESDDETFLYVRGHELVRAPGPHPLTHREGTRIHLTAGERVAFEFDVTDLANSSAASLHWVRPGADGEAPYVFETVPDSAFVSARRGSLQYAPVGLQVSSIGRTQATFDFYFPFGRADAGEVQVLSTDGTVLQTLSTGPEAGPVTVRNLSPGTIYDVRVRATSDESNPSPLATLRFATRAFDELYAPMYVGPLAAVSVTGATRIDFRDNAYNETGFVILRSPEASSGPAVEVGRLPATPPGDLGSVLSFVDTTAAPGLYRYLIDATGEGGLRAGTSTGQWPLQVFAAGTGLDATLYDNADFTDDPAVEGDPYRIAGAGLDEDWGAGAPAPVHDADDFSVTLRGSFRHHGPDDVTFYTASAGGIALKITDYETGRTLLDFDQLGVEREMPAYGFQDVAGNLRLRSGSLYAIEVRYSERAGGAGYRVGWSSANRPESNWQKVAPSQLFPPPPPPPWPAFTGLSATTVGHSRVFVHFDDTFATASAYELLYSRFPDGPFERTGDRAAPGSSQIASDLRLWADRHFYKVRAIQPEPTVPFVDSESIEVFEPVVEYQIRRDRFESAAGFDLSGSAQVADGRLRLTDAGAPAGGAALSTNLVSLHRDGFLAEFDFQTTDAAGPTALSFFVRRQHAPPGQPHAFEFRLAAAPGESNLNSATLLLGGIVHGAARAVPASAPDLDFDRFAPGGTLPPRVFRVRLEYLSDDQTLLLTVSDAASPAEKFQASFPVNFAQVFADTSTAYIGLAAGAGDGGARQEVLNFNYYWVPPGIVAVYVRGSAWQGQDNNPATTTFMEYLEAKGLGDDALGYRVLGRGRTPVPSNPDDIIPWINVDQLVIRYGSVPVGSIPTPGVFTVSGRNPAASSYTVTAVSSVAGDPRAFILTLNKPLGGGNPVTGVAPAPEENGDYVTLTVPGGSAGGGNFTVRFNVLQGETDHLGETGGSHTVQARDFAEIRKKFFKFTDSPVEGTEADYSPFHDVDGNGAILARDFAEVKKRFFQSLPPPPPAAAASFTASTSPTSDLSTDRRVIS